MEHIDAATTALFDHHASGDPPRATVTSPATARAYARSVVRERWESPSRRARDEDIVDLLLVVSELVTNAVRHGEGLAGFQVTPTQEGLRVAVRDHSDLVPDVSQGAGAFPVGHHGNGYGWPLIIRLAREITVDRHPGGGKTIGVLVPLRPAP
ncbi:ATP-binding protein [Streptomyces sp. NBC_01352]|uniref:Histidine kinase/HSP90-like ATPase domain-containing protein n=1 Tax=Streptomyces plumbiresistens TaxID=511811 RepID=A0ABP7RK97_9ACTN|nr:MULTISPECIES: ATP-binding protein [unclassified Streptomyces]MCX4703516.1 ATP-binding protein [Streptomyces sp. NBC_01373]